ncbi:MAG: hypothetical protein Q9M25_03835 [Mariprofundaceae bacterium]|nr:hypothetical protein [Mariprofundaceae bacterium]
MKIYSSLRFTALAVVAFFALIGGNAYAATTSLLANTNYVVTLEKFLSNGTVTTVSSTTVASDANGKIAFTFSNVPTCPTTNFLSIKVTTEADTATVVRRSFSPAPLANATNLLGANGVSTKQGEAMVEIGTLLGSDDPFAVLFGLMFTRTDILTANDITQIAIVGQEAIINGMEPDMTNAGVTAAQMTTFKNKLVCANTGKKDLSNFTSLFKSAVDTPAQAQADMAKAAGLLADIVIDAAAAAGIDLDIILAAFDTAGAKVATGTTGGNAIAAMATSVQSSMNQSVTSFVTRIGVQKVQQRYSAMLTALGVSGATVTRFNTAVSTLGTDMATIDTTYAKYFDDPVNFPMTSAIQTAIDNAYTTAFTTFGTSIASTNAEIGNGTGSMRAKVAAGMNAETGGSLTAANLSSIGTYRPFGGGTAVNWPIPQTGAVNFVADALVAGGSLAYTRTTLAIPTAMTWLSGGRSSFATIPSASFKALLMIQEDLDIAEFTRFAVFTGTETAAQRKAAKLTFKTNVANIVANITGTTDGTVNYTAAQKRAIVLSNQKPSLR